MMKYFINSLLTLCIISSNVFSQSLPDSIKNPLLAPFYYGVVSGDPLADRVILWTHVIPENPNNDITVTWEIATDTLFNNIVNSGDTTTNSESAFTVKVDATDLQANTWYYYRFIHDNIPSMIGRTRTLPEGAIDQLRIGVFTCADYKDGYFNAYDRIASRNDVDLIMHLGDYFYESASDEDNIRQMQPNVLLQTIEEYRGRYAYYRIDPQLAAAHQQYPWICTWDDHEFRNDAWKEGADDLSGQDWIDRRAIALKAYDEWMPVRWPDENDSLRIYRKFSWGDLAEIIMLDSRIIGRDEPIEDLESPLVQDEDREMIGTEQREWLFDNLDNSTKLWNILGQQTLVTTYKVFGNPIPDSYKSWDGFPAERNKIYNHLNDNDIDNVVFLSGDVHIPLAHDMPLDFDTYDATTGDGSVAVEFVTYSVTQGGDIDLDFDFIQSNNAHSKFADLSARGYVIADFRQDTMFGNFYSTPYLNYSLEETFQTNAFSVRGSKHLESLPTPSEKIGVNPPLAPSAPRIPLSIRTQIPYKNAVRAYPNPTKNTVIVESVIPNDKINVASLNIIDVNGKYVFSEKISKQFSSKEIDLSKQKSGVYFIHISNVDYNQVIKLVKE